MNFDEFTEDNYRKLLKIAKKNWKFIEISDYKMQGTVCFWRHDIDLSLHRAYRMALIEAEEGVKTTYFVNLHSQFYNVLEDKCSDLLLKIIRLGHKIGFHFDYRFYSTRFPEESIVDNMQREKELLENIFQVKIDGFSFHNPSNKILKTWQENEIGGMINTYGQYFRHNFFYCSDSNGYWRYQSLADILVQQKGRKIHILTHPGWWVPYPMSPLERVRRCIDGRGKTYMNRISID